MQTAKLQIVSLISCFYYSFNVVLHKDYFSRKWLYPKLIVVVFLHTAITTHRIFCNGSTWVVPNNVTNVGNFLKN